MKKQLSTLLAIIMLLTAIPLSTITTSAAGGVKDKLDAVISNYPNGSRWTSTFDGGSQCYGFAKLVIYKVFGASNQSGYTYRTWKYDGTPTSGMEVIGSVTSYSSSNIKSLLSKAKCGDVLQFNTTKQHSMIVYQVDSDGVWIYDCNWDGNCGISLRKSSFGAWSGRNSNKLTLLRANNYSDFQHTHSYTGARVYETEHPHTITQRCVDYASCGGYKVTGEYAEVKDCKKCWYASFDLSASSIAVKVGESKSISTTITGCWPDTRVLAMDYNTGLVDVTVGQNMLTFKGLKAGTGTFKLIIYSDSTKTRVIGSKSISVTVSQPVYTGKVSFDKTSMSLVMPTNQTGTLTIALSGTWPDGAGYTFDYNKDIISLSQSGTVLTITAQNAGSTDFTINIVNKNNNNELITSAVCPITVKNATYTIKYHANGGSGAPSAQTKTYGTPIRVSDVVPQREGYIFKGWATSSTATTSEYVMGDKYKSEESITLYAVWQKITLISIKANAPNKVLYYMGESLDTSGLKLQLEYSDGSLDTLDSGYTVEGFDSSTEGYKTVTVSYGGKTDKFEVYVIAPTVSLSEKSLVMNIGETKTIYATTSPKGESVKWSVSNKNVVTVSNGKITAVGPGTATVEATFYYKGYYSFASCDVAVKDSITLSSISISGLPTKMVYRIGEKIDTSGLKLKLTWSDGTTNIITSGFTTGSFDSATTGNKTIIVSYGGETASFEVEVMHDYKTTTVAATQSSNGSITKKCNFCGDVVSKSIIHKISSVNLSTTEYTYTGAKKTPSVTAKDSKGKKLVEGRDYKLTYSSSTRKEIGRYSVKVTFKGNYSGSKTLYFTIGPKNPSTVKAVLYGYDDVKVSWSKVSGASGYKVYYKKSTTSTWSSKTTTGTSLKLANLADGVKYDVKVVAYKIKGGYKCYNAGKSTSIYTLKKVTGIKATKSGTKVKVSWTNIPGETGYQISKSTKKSGTSIISTYKTTSGKYKTLAATRKKTYYYKVRAYKVVDGKKIYGPWSSVVKYVRK